MLASRGALVALVLVSACAPARSSTGPVFLDGRFDDWGRSSVVVVDEPDAEGAPVDILVVLGRDDPEWLYLAIELGREVNIQSLPGRLDLLIDADADAATGGTVGGMPGVDVVLELSQTEEPLFDGRGSGFALRAVRGDGSRGPALRYVSGVTAAPSWASARHELRMARSAADGLPGLGRDVRMKLLFVGDGGVADETATGSYTFRSRASGGSRPSIEARLSRPARSWRVAQWNVSGESFRDRPEEFARVLAAVDPDVILLDELYGDVTVSDLESFFDLAPLRGLGAWGFVLGESGGRQRAAVAARDLGIRAADGMRRVTYPAGALEALGEGASPGFQRLLDLEAGRQLSAAAAWVELDGVEVLFVPVDLQSAGWTGSPQDRLRAVQATTIRDHVAAETADVEAAVVIGGDLNLVGSDRPLLELVRGLDIDGSDLVPVDAPRLGERTHVTWRNAEGLFAPGRLDYLLVADRALTVANSFVFTTEDLDAVTLRRLGLESESSARLSDHLVVTADLRLRRD